MRGRLPAFLTELKDRRVLRAAFAYGLIAWVVVQVAATTFPLLYLPRWSATLVVVLAGLGLPLTMVLAWFFDIVPGGRARDVDGILAGASPAALDGPLCPDVDVGMESGAAVRSRQMVVPPSPTAIVGRAREQRELESLLADTDTRLITITGPGGIGKTRLAQEVARHAAPRFADGACFVPLAGRDATSPLVPTIAEALGLTLSAGEDPAARVSSYLRERSLLLYIDNFEQFTVHGEVLARILADAPGVKILVTSQERLNLRGEVLFPLRGLELPEDGETDLSGYAAAELFLQTARRANPDLELTAEDREAVQRICQYVQGVPLPIELAAAWVGVLSCEEVWGEIKRSRDFLVGSARDLPTRHRSLRAVFEASWTLLAETERDAFRRLSVFRGGFTRDAAGAVAGASLAALTSLLEKSFLQRTSAGRLEALETLRAFAAERLAADSITAADVAARHASYYAGFLQAREEQLQRMMDPRAANEVSSELANVREAWRWMGREGRTDEMATALEGLYAFYSARGWAREGAAVFDEAVEQLEARATATATPPSIDLIRRLRSREGVFLAQLAEYDRARRLLEESLAHFRAGEQWTETTLALEQLGVIATFQGDYARADELYRESQALSERHGSIEGTARSAIYLGLLAFTRGDYAEARRLFQQALELFRTVGDRRRVATALKNLGGVALRENAFEEADSLLQESLAIDRELGDLMALANSLQNLGCIAFRAGETVRAEAYLREGVTISRSMGFRRLQTFCLDQLGSVYYSEGRLDEAEATYREALAIAAEIQQVPVMLEILLDFARIFGDRAEPAKAARLVSLVLNHPASSEHTREQARQITISLAGTPLPDRGEADQETMEGALASLLRNHEHPSTAPVLTSAS